MKTNPTRAIDLKFDDGTLIGKVVWAYGECTVMTTVKSYREPRLDCDCDIAVRVMIDAIRHSDPSGHMEFLWADYLNAVSAAS